MKNAAVLGIIGALSLAGADLPIDHVTVAGADLKAMQAHLAAVGIASVYGGPHHDKVTEMALVSFPDGSYLELIALQSLADPKGVATHVWSQFLKRDGGPCAWALRAPDLEAAVRHIDGAGIAVSKPVAAGRERPDGVRLDWVTANIGSAARGTFFPFLIHDTTDRDLRAFPQGRPGNSDFRGVARVVIAVSDLDAAISHYRQAFGLPAAAIQEDPAFGARLATMGDAPVVLAQPLAQNTWLSERLQQFGEAPCAFILAAEQVPSTVSQALWFGKAISWVDTGKLGWRLGIQKAR